MERNLELEKNNLRHLKEIYDYKAPFIGDYLNVSRDNVNKWVNGRKIPEHHLAPLCDLFNVTINQFCKEDLTQIMISEKEKLSMGEKLYEYASIMLSDQEYEKAIRAWVNAISLGNTDAIIALNNLVLEVPTASEIDVPEENGPNEMIMDMIKQAFDDYADSSILRAIRVAVKNQYAFMF